MGRLNLKVVTRLNPADANPQAAVDDTPAEPPSRAAALFWSCGSFEFYPRVAGCAFGRTVSYLLILACACALAVTAFFSFQVLPALQAVSRGLPELVLNGGRLVVAPGAPAVLYDDGAHGMLLVRLAVDQEPPAVERRYDVVLTLRAHGADMAFAGRVFRVRWPQGVSLVVQPLDAVAFMDAWWPLLCMAVFACATGWFWVSRFVHALIGAMLFVLIGGAARGGTLGQGFNIAAYALTPGTLLMVGLLWIHAFYKFPPVVYAWSWAFYAVVGIIYLVGALSALPRRSTNPWETKAWDDPAT